MSYIYKQDNVELTEIMQEFSWQRENNTRNNKTYRIT